MNHINHQTLELTSDEENKTQKLFLKVIWFYYSKMQCVVMDRRE